MASSRKKQDEKNVKTLRELGALPQNKYCFDCNQRGPTYVNVTIGSFVCTKCSGMLRGLTPPHRVKSISMATFTMEEIELLRNRGNDYCKHVWLGLYESKTSLLGSDRGDDQAIRDFMIDKYERKRYYLDPAQALRNGFVVNNNKTDLTKSKSTTNNNNNNNNSKNISSNTNRILSSSSIDGGSNKSIIKLLNGNATEYNRKRPEVINRNIINNNLNNTASNNFAVNFNTNNISSSISSDDAFGGGGSSNLSNGSNSANSNINGLITTTGSTVTIKQPQESFANFDNNPVFNSNNTTTTCVPLSSSTFNNNSTISLQQQQHQKQQPNNMMAKGSVTAGVAVPPPPTIDRYAALKDLDNEFKSHQQTTNNNNTNNNNNNNGDSSCWTSSSSNGGSLYSSPTPTTGSMYSSPSPQNSLFGSPNQGQFLNAFQNQDNNTFSNPFSNGLNWPANNGFGVINQQQQQMFANPFRDSAKMNGFTQNSTQGFQQPPAGGGFPTSGSNNITSNGTPWGAASVNPFKVGGATATSSSSASSSNIMNSNNPFL